MIELFKMGGPLFMGILTLELLAVFFCAVRYHVKNYTTKNDLDLVKSFGVLALVTGILGQLLGLFSAFKAIQSVGSVSPAILVGGLKVSMISTIYGIIIFLIAYLVWIFFKSRSQTN